MQSSRPLENAKPTKSFDILGFVADYWKRVLLLGTVLVVLVLPPMVYLKYTYYTATGILRVAPTMPTLLSRSDGQNLGGQYGSYVKTQVMRLGHYEILMSALNRLPPAIKNEFVQPEESLLEAAQRLQGELFIHAIPRTHLISIVMRGNQPTGLAEVVNSVVNVYLEKVSEEEAGLDNRRLAYLRQEQKNVEAKITATNQKIGQIASQLGLQSFDPADDIYQQRRVQIQSAYLQAQNDAIKQRITLERAKDFEKDPLVESGQELLIQQQLSNHPLYAQTRQWTYARLRELTTRLTGMMEDNPERQFIMRQKEQLKADLEKLAEDVRDEVIESINQQRRYAKEQKIVDAELNYDVTKYLEEELRKEYTGIEQEVGNRSKIIQEGTQYRQELDRLQNLYQQLEQRIYSLSVESKAPGRITLEALARSVQSSNMRKLLIMALMAGYGSALALCILVALRDKTVRTRKDVEDAIGAPPSWPIPYVQGHHALSRIMLDQPNHKASIAIRSLAVKLGKVHDEQGAKVVLFTGFSRRAGTTKVAINAATACVAQVQKVLLLEMNDLSQSIKQYVVGSRRTKHGDVEVIHDEDRGIDVLTWSEIHSVKRRSMSQLRELVESIKDDYDLVIIDTAPLLQSDLTEFMVLQADVVVPVVSGNQVDYGNVYNGIQLLQRLEVPFICPVLNWMRAKVQPWYRFLPHSLRRRRQRKAVRRKEAARLKAQDEIYKAQEIGG